MLLNLDSLVSKYNLKIKGIIHVGAHVGEEVHIYKKNFGNEINIHLFEPQKEYFQILQEKFVKTKNINIYNFGCGDSKQSLQINKASNKGESSSLLNPKLHLDLHPEVEFIGKESIQVDRLDEFKISDSNYIFNFFKKFNIPTLALNNSCITVDEYQNQLKKPPSIKQHYYFIEKLDYFYHKTFPDLTISCGITHKEDKIHKNFKNVSPIYRENLKVKQDEKKKTCMIMLSGASNLKSFIDLSFIDDEIIFLNKPDYIKENKNTKFVSKVHDNIEYLNKADYFIINSGYSAISEAIFMKKPMITMPINNHSEQWLNAKKVEDKNYGLLANLSNLEEKYKEFSTNFSYYRASLNNKENEINGSEEIADLLMKF